MKREVRDEWLDSMEPGEPDAERSRRDLRRVNFVMGNERWIRRILRGRPSVARGGITEWGGGGGHLTAQLAADHPDAPLRVIDRVPRPAILSALGDRLSWECRDVLDSSAPSGGVLVANLFLHHFEEDALRVLGGFAAAAEMVVACEPDRSARALALGGLALPFCGRVTRHDMPVSIRAGFAAGELGRMLGLSSPRWRICERSTWTGARRFVALRC